MVSLNILKKKTEQQKSMKEGGFLCVYISSRIEKLKKLLNRKSI